MHLCITEGGIVLVHCLSSMQRSCTIILLYLLKYYNMTPQMAIEYIRKKRRIAFYGDEIHYMKAIDLFYNSL
jgi:protein-tyrosine phosphatase